MAGQPPPAQAAQVQAKNGVAAAGTEGRGPEYPNPPELGWREGPRYPNPPDPANPDPATLREQWLFATRQYSRWYSRAWGAAILSGAALFAVGWAVKGSNPSVPAATATAATRSSTRQAKNRRHRRSASGCLGLCC